MISRNIKCLGFRRFTLHLRRQKGYSHIWRWRCRCSFSVFSVRWNFPAIPQRGAKCYCWRNPYFLLAWSARERDTNRPLFTAVLLRERIDLFRSLKGVISGIWPMWSFRPLVWFKRLHQYYSAEFVINHCIDIHVRDLLPKVLTAANSNLRRAIIFNITSFPKREQRGIDRMKI